MTSPGSGVANARNAETPMAETTQPMNDELLIESVDLDNEDQIQACVDLIAEFASMYGPAPDWPVRTSFPELLRRRGAILYLARLNDQPVGVALCQLALVSFTASEALNIHDIFITESARGHGVGRRLLNQVIDHARSLGCMKVTLEVLKDNEQARHLYRAAGFGLPEDGAEETHFLSLKLD